MKETTENNILLAEFLGWKRETVVRGRNGRTYDFLCPEYIEVIGESDAEYCSDCGRDTYRKDYLFGEDLLFHSSWDWLMLVVEKIETLETEDKRTFTIDMHLDSVLIFEYALTADEVVFTEGEGRLKNLHNACIEFVKWYNENRK